MSGLGEATATRPLLAPLLGYQFRHHNHHRPLERARHPDYAAAAPWRVSAPSSASAATLAIACARSSSPSSRRNGSPFLSATMTPPYRFPSRIGAISNELTLMVSASGTERALRSSTTAFDGRETSRLSGDSSIEVSSGRLVNGGP